jgi:hypothetical protein
MTDARLQRLTLWAAIAGMLISGIGLLPLARLVPPHHPSSSAEQIVAFWAEDTNLKRLGLILCLIGISLALTFPVVIFLQMRRVGGPSSPLPWIQLISGVLGFAPPLMCFLIWQALAFRPDRADPALVLALNDVAWFAFMLPSVGAIQIIAITLCAFQDTEAKVFPRWSAYLNLWIAISFAPAMCIIYFKRGPIAWDGLIAFWVPLAMFAFWLAAMFVIMFRAIASQEAQQLSARALADAA